MALETRRYKQLLPGWLQPYYGNPAIFRIICSENDFEINNNSIDLLQDLTYQQNMYNKTNEFKYMKDIIITCLALK